MTARIQQAFKMLLAAWLVMSVLTASALVHLPELHAQLHGEASSCCAAACGSSHDHCPDSEAPEDHRCLTELLAAGCADAPLAIGFVPMDFVAISEVALLEAGQFSDCISPAATFGRAPPIG